MYPAQKLTFIELRKARRRIEDMVGAMLTAGMTYEQTADIRNAAMLLAKVEGIADAGLYVKRQQEAKQPYSQEIFDAAVQDLVDTVL